MTNPDTAQNAVDRSELQSGALPSELKRRCCCFDGGDRRKKSIFTLVCKAED